MAALFLFLKFIRNIFPDINFPFEVIVIYRCFDAQIAVILLNLASASEK